jgi:hypothetical protein
MNTRQSRSDSWSVEIRMLIAGMDGYKHGWIAAIEEPVADSTLQFSLLKCRSQS